MSARIADYVVRVSRVGDRGENLKSPAEQRARVEQAAAREGVTLRHGHEELDTSGGAALDKRPGLLAAVEAVERGEIARSIFEPLKAHMEQATGGTTGPGFALP